MTDFSAAVTEILRKAVEGTLKCHVLPQSGISFLRQSLKNNCVTLFWILIQPPAAILAMLHWLWLQRIFFSLHEALEPGVTWTGKSAFLWNHLSGDSLLSDICHPGSFHFWGALGVGFVLFFSAFSNWTNVNTCGIKEESLCANRVLPPFTGGSCKSCEIFEWGKKMNNSLDLGRKAIQLWIHFGETLG